MDNFKETIKKYLDMILDQQKKVDKIYWVDFNQPCDNAKLKSINDEYCEALNELQDMKKKFLEHIH